MSGGEFLVSGWLINYYWCHFFRRLLSCIPTDSFFFNNIYRNSGWKENGWKKYIIIIININRVTEPCQYTDPMMMYRQNAWCEIIFSFTIFMINVWLAGRLDGWTRSIRCLSWVMQLKSRCNCILMQTGRAASEIYSLWLQNFGSFQGKESNILFIFVIFVTVFFWHSDSIASFWSMTKDCLWPNLYYYFLMILWSIRWIQKNLPWNSFICENLKSLLSKCQ